MEVDGLSNRPVCLIWGRNSPCSCHQMPQVRPRRRRVVSHVFSSKRLYHTPELLHALQSQTLEQNGRVSLESLVQPLSFFTISSTPSVIISGGGFSVLGNTCPQTPSLPLSFLPQMCPIFGSDRARYGFVENDLPYIMLGWWEACMVL